MVLHLFSPTTGREVKYGSFPPPPSPSRRVIFSFTHQRRSSSLRAGAFLFSPLSLYRRFSLHHRSAAATRFPFFSPGRGASIFDPLFFSPAMSIRLKFHAGIFPFLFSSPLTTPNPFAPTAREAIYLLPSKFCCLYRSPRAVGKWVFFFPPFGECPPRILIIRVLLLFCGQHADDGRGLNRYPFFFP